ncbi:NUOA3 [Auxenochlorella protothecoides x Auxenochlorella symbiontica]
MGFLAGLRTAMHQEPIIVWSVIIGGTGGLCPGWQSGSRTGGALRREASAELWIVAPNSVPRSSRTRRMACTGSRCVLLRTGGRACAPRHPPKEVTPSPFLTHSGVILPLVGPPIREALGYGRSYPAAPPPLKDVLDRNVKTPALDAK